MNKAYLLTGGNLGDRESNLAQAIVYLNRFCGTVLRQSSLYETAPWGNPDQPAFLNQALELESRFPAETLLQMILLTEEKMGRRREEKYGPRVIDIDILLFNDSIIDTAQLHIPHPQLAFRRFALQPLASIAPDLLHPVSGKTIAALLDECPDPLVVKKL